MNWTLFSRLDRAVARATKLDVRRDRQCFAATLREQVPELFADLAWAQAETAAFVLADAALRLITGLPREIDEAAALLVDGTPLAANEALARTGALVYVACDDDLLSDELPVGYGLIDDALLLRVAEVGPPAAWTNNPHVTELVLECRLLALLHPRELLPRLATGIDEILRTIVSFASVPHGQLKQIQRRLIEHPPTSVRELLDARPIVDDQLGSERPARLAAIAGRVRRVDGDRAWIACEDGLELLVREGQPVQVASSG